MAQDVRQAERVRRFEAVLSVAAPFLDAVLAVGDRLSRLAEPVDHEHYPVRSGDGEAAEPNSLAAPRRRGGRGGRASDDAESTEPRT